MRKVLVVALFAIALLPAADKQTFLGTITDSECPRGDHSGMRMGPTDAECARACIMFHGAAYVLFDGKTVYKLSDQKMPDKLAGQRVKLIGVLDAKTSTIRVESISPLPKK